MAGDEGKSLQSAEPQMVNYACDDTNPDVWLISSLHFVAGSNASLRFQSNYCTMSENCQSQCPDPSRMKRYGQRSGSKNRIRVGLPSRRSSDLVRQIRRDLYL